MLPNFILLETVVREDGVSPELDLGESKGKFLNITLGITRILEQQSLDLSVWGSADKADWGAKPVAAFPQKFYCGTYSLLVDLTGRPEVQYLRVQWKLNRWGRGDSKPMFGFYVAAEEITGALASTAQS
jgi:hypothetical protein